jgi:hypothetical protein
MTPEELEK